MKTPDSTVLGGLYGTAFELGANLATEGQTVSEAIGNLNIDLVTLGCDPNVTTEYVMGSWRSMVLRPGTQPFTRAVRGATHSIIYREPARPSAYIPTGEPRILEETPQGTTIMAEAVAAEPFAIAWTNGRILRSVLAGMDAKGYSESRGRRDMRSEFDEILDELWSRGSRSVFFEPQTVSAIMREAGVCNLASKVKGIGRFTHFAREFGLELAIQRAVPEELLAKAYPL